ncbi:MAG: hypothetical protein ISR80_05120 [Nitrosopumilus sp.]|nr:hypothetical protein [Nitrosopumilus sp.]
MQKDRDSRILESLGKKNNQTFTELRKDTKMGTESLVLGLDELIEKKIVTKDDKSKKYAIRTDIKSKILLAPQKQKNNPMNMDLDIAMDELRESDTPFEIGYALLRSAMFYLSKLTLELHSPDLNEIERHECKRFIKKCNDTIEQTFDVLGRIDIDQTIALKHGLDNATTIPNFEVISANKANPRQIRKAHKIAKKIEGKM